MVETVRKVITSVPKKVAKTNVVSRRTNASAAVVPRVAQRAAPKVNFNYVPSRQGMTLEQRRAEKRQWTKQFNVYDQAGTECSLHDKCLFCNILKTNSPDKILY